MVVEEGGGNRNIQGFKVLQVACAVHTVDPDHPLPPPKETINPHFLYE
jgi:hypothetical protein